jgi:hypothetical protein
MRKAGGLDGVGEGEREGTPFQQNSTDQRFKTALYRIFPQNKDLQCFKTAFCSFFHKIQYDIVFKTVFCRFPTD